MRFEAANTVMASLSSDDIFKGYSFWLERMEPKTGEKDIYMILHAREDDRQHRRVCAGKRFDNHHAALPITRWYRFLAVVLSSVERGITFPLVVTLAGIGAILTIAYFFG